MVALREEAVDRERSGEQAEPSQPLSRTGERDAPVVPAPQILGQIRYEGVVDHEAGRRERPHPVINPLEVVPSVASTVNDIMSALQRQEVGVRALTIVFLQTYQKVRQ